MSIRSTKPINKKPLWIAGIARGHNAGVCLLKDGEIVFSIEEERLTRQKYDGGPFASMLKIKEYTDKLDYLVVAHTQGLNENCGRIDFTGDDMYTGFARKIGLISRNKNVYDHPQVIDLSNMHHKLHAACAFYRSGFKEAVSLVVDGAGTYIHLNVNDDNILTWEVESIFECSYPARFKTVYKHLATRGPLRGTLVDEFDSTMYGEPGYHELLLTDTAGIVKVYEAVTQYCDFMAIEAGKTMGLFPYGKPNKDIPEFYHNDMKYPLSNKNLFVPNYPNGAFVNQLLYPQLEASGEDDDLSKLQNRRDMAYACQHETQKMVLNLIKKAVKDTGYKNVVLSGGYGLNCVANYYYLDHLKDEGINLYVEPISNDAGTAMGAAMMFHRTITEDITSKPQATTLYLGPDQKYTLDQINDLTSSINGEVVDSTHLDVVDLLIKKNIVAIFQGRSENGPRALGNRSILFDPRVPDGKDFVNQVKHREYFRPFAGTILKEHVHDWFDLRGMDESPTMMYAVNCQAGVEEKIPSIIHVDGTCRIQTVTPEQNQHYYDLINEFYKKTDVPILFNTSFNLGGDPLVETLQDALETLSKSDIEYLYLPEYQKLIIVKNNK